MFPNRIRAISTPRLNTLQYLYLAPINLVISQGSQTIPNLGVGFILRCFQNLSMPDLATLRCPWQDSRYTRGRFNSVLSSLIPLSLGVQTISSSFLLKVRMLAYYLHMLSFSMKRFLIMQVCPDVSSGQVVTGSNPSSLTARFLIVFSQQHNSLFELLRSDLLK